MTVNWPISTCKSDRDRVLIGVGNVSDHIIGRLRISNLYGNKLEIIRNIYVIIFNNIFIISNKYIIYT